MQARTSYGLRVHLLLGLRLEVSSLGTQSNEDWVKDVLSRRMPWLLSPPMAFSLLLCLHHEAAGGMRQSLASVLGQQGPLEPLDTGPPRPLQWASRDL